METAYFAGGCFWCVEALFKTLRGVKSVQSGYAGGSKENPAYLDVMSGLSGHAETVKIEYDPKVIKYADLLKVFFFAHDPTTLNKQGNDVGTQYRSAIFYDNEKQREEALKYIALLNDKHEFSRPIVTEVSPLHGFFSAEEYHRNFYEKHRGHPYCQLIIEPKLEKIRDEFKDMTFSNSA